MEIEKPERVVAASPRLTMYCKENRMTRELYWAGFGFQIWCQLLTHIIRASEASLIVVDEPEVYLHPDIQRQLIGLLRSYNSDVLVATHSAEVISEADPSEILLVDRNQESAQRLKVIEGVQAVLYSIGSLQNITITRLARNRRLLFTEGEKDFGILREFARLCGMSELAAGCDITIVSSGGQSSKDRVKNVAWAFEKTLSMPLSIAAVYDRDFLSAEEVADNSTELLTRLSLVHYLQRKEIENYLLSAEVLQRALQSALADKARRTGLSAELPLDVSKALERITSAQKSYLLAQYIANRVEYLSQIKKSAATITQETAEWFESAWENTNMRMTLVPGKQTLQELRTEIQNKHSISMTNHRIVESFRTSEIPEELTNLLSSLERFRKVKAWGSNDRPA